MAKKADKTEVFGLGESLSKIRDIKSKLKAALKKDIFTNVDTDNLTIDRLSSGSLAIDIILGGCKEKGFGFPVGRLVEVYGESHSGKTAIVLSTIAEAQRNGHVVAYCDQENSLDLAFAKSIGVDVSEDALLLFSADSAEEAFTAIESLVQSGVAKLIVLDSVATCIPQAVLEKGYDENSMGLLPKLFTRFTNSMLKKLSENKVTLICINQIREKMNSGPYANPNYRPGGKASIFNYSVCLETYRESKPFKNAEEEDVGVEIRLSTKKNKTAQPFKTARVFLSFAGGFLKNESLFDVALIKNVIRQGGAWYYFEEEKWNGKANVIDAMVSDPNLVKQINAAIIESL